MTDGVLQKGRFCRFPKNEKQPSLDKSLGEAAFGKSPGLVAEVMDVIGEMIEAVNEKYRLGCQPAHAVKVLSISSVVLLCVSGGWWAVYRQKDLSMGGERWQGGAVTCSMSMRFSKEGHFQTIFMTLDEDLNAPPGKVPPPLPRCSLSKLTLVVSCQKCP